MKKLALKMTSLMAGLSAFAVNAMAQGSGPAFFNTSGNTAPDVAATGTLTDNIVTIINYVIGALGLVAVAFLIYAGILMVTAGGDDGQIDKAKKIITYSVIGLVIIILSYTIVTFVINILS